MPPWYNDHMNENEIDVFICINYNSDGEIAHLEVLNSAPSENIAQAEGWDAVFAANINGGDSMPWRF